MIELDRICRACPGDPDEPGACDSACPSLPEQVALDLDNPPDLAAGERAPDHWTPAMKETGR